MRVTFLWMGKTAERWLQEGVDGYVNRLKHYVGLTVDIVPIPKNLSKQNIERQKELEGEAMLGRIAPSDTLILLDPKGTMHTSEGLSAFFQEKMSANAKHLVMAIGGPFGFSSRLYQRANGLISFSKLTFPHQLFRLMLCEQVYRAFTILRGEGYHH